MARWVVGDFDAYIAKIRGALNGYAALRSSARTILGLCFRIFVMSPAMLVAAAGIAVLGVSSGQNIRIIALNVVAAGVSLQIGYFIGAILAEYQRRETEQADGRMDR